MPNTSLSQYNREHVVVEVSANQPLSNELLVEMSHALDEAEAKEAILLLYITESGDPAAWPGNTTVHQVSKWERVLRRIERSSVLTVALASGTCSFLALEFLLIATYRVAVVDFTLAAAVISTPAWPSMALFRLPHEIGQARARRLLLSPPGLSAEEIAVFDILDHVARDKSAAKAHIVEMLARSPLQDFAVRRRLMLDAVTMSFEEALGAHLAACDRHLREDNHVPATAEGFGGVGSNMAGDR